jgi:hypothetical protein
LHPSIGPSLRILQAEGLVRYRNRSPDTLTSRMPERRSSPLGSKPRRERQFL